ncbi:hypothetical protein [Streptomyces sp. NBC_00347]|uniref:hypothetical protein n=1 Tax=Streptomyces sp. NBC_00347 TaxID=2975721 RepID=UPI00225784E9|nr:hypothetical protein [Streptomyces sp. NBC_00347]MCX5129431.1 hypothetical protein [Streptomyces sp. NBC_00347]
MGRRPRDHDRDAEAIKAAAERLLAGTPLRSASGRLTATELIAESGLRRDVVYPRHQGLVDEFRLRAKAQGVVPTAMQDLAAKYSEVLAELEETKALLAEERELSAYLRRSAVELSIEVENVLREQEEAEDAAVVPFPRRDWWSRPPGAGPRLRQ